MEKEILREKNSSYYKVLIYFKKSYRLKVKFNNEYPLGIYEICSLKHNAKYTGIFCYHNNESKVTMDVLIQSISQQSTIKKLIAQLNSGKPNMFEISMSSNGAVYGKVTLLNQMIGQSEHHQISTDQRKNNDQTDTSNFSMISFLRNPFA